jgi:formyl-CoA transferase
VTELLQARQVAAFPVMNGRHVFSDPHLAARSFIAEIDHPEFGKRSLFAPPWKFAEAQVEIRSRSPLISEHNRHIMMTLLGRTADDVTELEQKGVLVAGSSLLETGSPQPV